MREIQFKKLVEVLAPAVGVGGGQAVDQVDADIIEARLFGPLDALKGMFSVMTATQVFQVFVKEALDADAKTIYTERSQAF